MGSSPMLDSNILISTARGVAIEVAASHKINLSADGLQGVDILVKETLPRLQQLAQERSFDFQRWKKHVHGVSEKLTQDFQGRKVMEVSSAGDIPERYYQLGLNVWPKD